MVDTNTSTATAVKTGFLASVTSVEEAYWPVLMVLALLIAKTLLRAPWAHCPCVPYPTLCAP